MRQLSVGQVPGAPLTPMLATTGPLPAGPGWAYEFKWDGVRALADLGGGPTRAATRAPASRSPPPTPSSPGPGRAASTTPCSTARWSSSTRPGGPRSRALAERMHVREPARAARLAATSPVTYLIFDVLRCATASDLTGCAVPRTPARLLDGLALGGGAVGGAAVVRRRRRRPWPAAAEHGSGRAWSPSGPARVYRPGLRSPDWVKVKLEETGDFVVGGWRPGARALGALLVGVPGPDGGSTFRGRVGGGHLGAAERDLLGALRAAARRPRSPFAGHVPREDARGAIWVTPRARGRGASTATAPRTAGCGSPGSCGCGPTSRPEEVERCLTGSGSRWTAGTLDLSNLDKVLYPAGRLHQGRGHRLLHPDRAGPAAAPAPTGR